MADGGANVALEDLRSLDGLTVVKLRALFKKYDLKAGKKNKAELKETLEVHLGEMHASAKKKGASCVEENAQNSQADTAALPCIPLARSKSASTAVSRPKKPEALGRQSSMAIRKGTRTSEATRLESFRAGLEKAVKSLEAVETVGDRVPSKEEQRVLREFERVFQAVHSLPANGSECARGEGNAAVIEYLLKATKRVSAWIQERQCMPTFGAFYYALVMQLSQAMPLGKLERPTEYQTRVTSNASDATEEEASDDVPLHAATTEILLPLHEKTCAKFLRWVEEWTSGSSPAGALSPSAALRPLERTPWPTFTGDSFCLGVACREPILALLAGQQCRHLLDHLDTLGPDEDVTHEGQWMRVTVTYLERLLKTLHLAPPGHARVFSGSIVVRPFRELVRQSMAVRIKLLTSIHDAFGDTVQLPDSALDALEAFLGHCAAVAEAISESTHLADDDVAKLLRYRTDSYVAQARVNFLRTAAPEEGALEYLEEGASMLLSSNNNALIDTLLPHMAKAYHGYHLELADEPDLAVMVLARGCRVLQTAVEEGKGGANVKKACATFENFLSKRICNSVAGRLKAIEESLALSIYDHDSAGVDDCVKAFVMLKHQFPTAVIPVGDGADLSDSDDSSAPHEILPHTLIDTLTEISGISTDIFADVLERQLFYEQDLLLQRASELLTSKKFASALGNEPPAHLVEDRVLLVRLFDQAENELFEYLLLCVLKSRSPRRANVLLRKAVSMRNSSQYTRRMGLGTSLPSDEEEVGSKWANAGRTASKPAPRNPFEEKVKAILSEAISILASAPEGKNLPVGAASVAQLLADAYFWRATVAWELYSSSKALPDVCAAYEALTRAAALEKEGEPLSMALSGTIQRVTDLLYMFGETQKTAEGSLRLSHQGIEGSDGEDNEDLESLWYTLQTEFFSDTSTGEAPVHEGDVDKAMHMALLLQARSAVLSGLLELSRDGRSPAVSLLTSGTMELLQGHQLQLSIPGTLLSRPHMAWRNCGASVDTLELLGQLAELDGDDRRAEGYYKLGLLNSERIQALSSPVRFFMRLGELHYRRQELERSRKDFERTLNACKALRGAVEKNKRCFPALAHWSSREWVTAYEAPALIRMGDLCMKEAKPAQARQQYLAAAAALDAVEDSVEELTVAVAAMAVSDNSCRQPASWLQERASLARGAIAAKLSCCTATKGELEVAVKHIQAALRALKGSSAPVQLQKAKLHFRQAQIVAEVGPSKAAGLLFERLTAEAFSEALGMAPPKFMRELCHGAVLFRARQSGGCVVPAEHVWESAFLHCFCAQASAVHAMERIGAARAPCSPEWRAALGLLDHRAAKSLHARVTHFRSLVEQLPEGHTICAVSVTPDDRSLVVTRLRQGRRPIVVALPLVEPAAAQLARLQALHEEVDASWKKYNVPGRVAEYAKEKKRLDACMGELVAQWQRQWLGCWAALLMAVPSDAAVARELTAEAKRQAREGEEDWQAMELYLTALSHSPAADCAALAEAMLREKPKRQRPLAQWKSFASEPLQLLLAGQLQALPWEAMPLLAGRAVCRVPFVHMQAVAEALHPSGGGGSGGVVEVDAARSFYLLNPSNDRNLARTVERLEAPLAAQEWRGIVCRRPSRRQMEAALAQHEAFLYCGHGSSERYLDRQRLCSAVHRAPLSLLMGCSSALLKARGDFDADGFALRLLLAGAPAVVGFLWTVTDKDCDRVTASLAQWLGASHAHFGHRDVAVAPPSAARLADAVPLARTTTTLRHLNGAALVYYGVPDVRRRSA